MILHPKDQPHQKNTLCWEDHVPTHFHQLLFKLVPKDRVDYLLSKGTQFVTVQHGDIDLYIDRAQTMSNVDQVIVLIVTFNLLASIIFLCTACNRV